MPKHICAADSQKKHTLHTFAAKEILDCQALCTSVVFPHIIWPAFPLGSASPLRMQSSSTFDDRVA